MCVSNRVFLQMENISMTFPGVKALEDVHFDVCEGEVHALMGENGAGKSTLIKILSGVQRPDPGSRILMDGKPVSFNNVNDSIQLGINAIYQDLSLFPNLTVAENIYLGRSKNGLINWSTCTQVANQALEKLDMRLNIHEKLGELSIAKQQLVAIARAISLHSRLLIMDEPTASLSFNEIETLYRIIDKLKKENIAILFISHKLDEVFKVADRITVLRDGKWIGCKPVEELNDESLVSMMVGRSVPYAALNEHSHASEKILEVKAISKRGNYRDISFELHRGEILAFTGLVGAGRSETVKALYGLNTPETGEILLNGKKIEIKNVRQALKNKIAMIPEDRHLEGLVLDLKLRDNVVISILDDILHKGGFIDEGKSGEISDKYIEMLSIRPAQKDKLAKDFSGGNQQKIAIAKGLVTQPEILIIDEPTHGVDIAAKTEIHRLLKELALSGMAIIVVSSEWQEVFALSDTVIVMRHGRIVHQDKTICCDKELMMKKAILGK